MRLLVTALLLAVSGGNNPAALASAATLTAQISRETSDPGGAGNISPPAFGLSSEPYLKLAGNLGMADGNSVGTCNVILRYLGEGECSAPLGLFQGKTSQYENLAQVDLTSRTNLARAKLAAQGVTYGYDPENEGFFLKIELSRRKVDIFP
jgi:hypothetical protein